MADVHILTCQTCGSDEGLDGSDGFFYCLRCGSQFEDVVDTAVDDDDLFNKGGDTGGGGGAVYKASHQRRRQHQPPDAIKAEPISQYDSFYDSQSNFIRNLRLEDEAPQWSDHGQVKREEFDNPPTVPADFGGFKAPSTEDFLIEIRMRYVMGLQIMIELQCEALVKEFKVTPLICGLVGPIWLRFVSTTGVFDDDWANKAIFESEMQNQERKYHKVRAKYSEEPRNDYDQRAAMIWFRSLKKMIPLAYTVAVSFLACHLAREAVLPSDMMKWTREGKLPYFSAFVEIERRMGHPSSACPISSSVMFRPQRAVPVQKLESFAAYIAQFIGLELPPVNFNAIAYRYLQKLSLPVGKIIPYACRIYEWSMPPELWLSLSKNYFRLPTHVCVMSILVVAIRILYNINGFGEWEKSLSLNGGTNDNGDIGTAFASHDGHDFVKDSAEDPAGPQKHELDSAGLLQHLQARYNEIADTYEYSKDLTTYLKYCRDVVFAGSEPSYGNHEEESMMQYLWNFYQNEENVNPSDLEQSNTFNQRRSRGEGCVSTTSKEEKMRKECFNEPSSDDGTYLADNSAASVDDDNSAASLPDGEDSDSDEHCSGKTLVKEAIKRMKLDMEENRFCYIPPTRVKRNKLDYLHYVRKRDEGALTYVAHADYYILLRACARVAQVDIRILHIGVLSLERRLAWLENRIDKCLHSKPTSISCQFCSDMDTGNVSDHISGQTNLNI